MKTNKCIFLFQFNLILVFIFIFIKKNRIKIRHFCHLLLHNYSLERVLSKEEKEKKQQ